MKTDDPNGSPPPNLETFTAPELEARVVAWVLGQASAFEAAELARLAAEKPELAILKRRLEAVHGLVREANLPDAAPLRLAPARRAKLLATLGASRPAGRQAVALPQQTGAATPSSRSVIPRSPPRERRDNPRARPEPSRRARPEPAERARRFAWLRRPTLIEGLAACLVIGLIASIIFPTVGAVQLNVRRSAERQQLAAQSEGMGWRDSGLPPPSSPVAAARPPAPRGGAGGGPGGGGAVGGRGGGGFAINRGGSPAARPTPVETYSGNLAQATSITASGLAGARTVTYPNDVILGSGSVGGFAPRLPAATPAPAGQVGREMPPASEAQQQQAARNALAALGNLQSYARADEAGDADATYRLGGGGGELQLLSRNALPAPTPAVEVAGEMQMSIDRASIANTTGSNPPPTSGIPVAIGGYLPASWTHTSGAATDRFDIDSALLKFTENSGPASGVATFNYIPSPTQPPPPPAASDRVQDAQRNGVDLVPGFAGISAGNLEQNLGAVTLPNTSTPGVVTSNNATLALQSGSVSAILGGAGGVTKSGAGTLTLSGGTITDISGGYGLIPRGKVSDGGVVSNSWAGNTNGGTIVTAAAQDTASLVKTGAGDWSVSGASTYTGGTVTLSGSNSFTGGTTVNGGTLVLGGITTVGSGGTLSVSGWTLSKSGTGTLFLTGENTYTGGTTVAGGTLSIGSSNALGSGTLTLSGGTALGANRTSSVSAGAFAVTGSVSGLAGAARGQGGRGGSANNIIHEPGSALDFTLPADQPGSLTVNSLRFEQNGANVQLGGGFTVATAGVLVSGNAADKAKETAQLVAQGRAQYNAGDLEGAQKAFREVAGTDAQNSDAQYFLNQIDRQMTVAATNARESMATAMLRGVTEGWSPVGSAPAAKAEDGKSTVQVAGGLQAAVDRASLGTTGSISSAIIPISSPTAVRMANAGQGQAGADPFSSGANVDGAAVMKFLQEAGANVTGTLAGGALVLSGSPRDLDRTRDILSRYNEVKQVTIDTKFLEVTEGNLREAGINWGQIGGGTAAALGAQASASSYSYSISLPFALGAPAGYDTARPNPANQGEVLHQIDPVLTQARFYVKVPAGQTSTNAPVAMPSWDTLQTWYDVSAQLAASSPSPANQGQVPIHVEPVLTQARFINVVPSTPAQQALGDLARAQSDAPRVPSEADKQKAAEAQKAALLKLATVDEARADQNAVSTFALHVGDSSFKLAQAALARGERPDPAGIRPEEFYNAFDYGDPAPAAGEPVGARVEQAAHPFLQSHNLVRVAVKVPAAGRSAAQPLRLTVLLDTSGSMEREDRAATVRAAMRALASLLGPADRVTLISFARTPRLLVVDLPGNEAAKLVDLAGRTPAEGGTNLEEALKAAAELAAKSFLAGAQNRVVLMTDGAANLGNADPERLAAQVADLREKKIAFDACGVGTAGLDDAVLEALTRKGGGRYYVLARPEEADARFARKLAGAFRPAAENVKTQVTFNPARVGGWRLVGFEQHRLNKEDFRNDAVDGAATIAAEEAAVALYQVEVLPGGDGDLGEVAVRFRDAATGEMVERTWPLLHDARAPAFDRAAPTMRLAGTAALLADKLRGGAMADAIRLGELASVVNGLRSHHPKSPRVQELVTMFGQMRRLLGDN